MPPSRSSVLLSLFPCGGDATAAVAATVNATFLRKGRKGKVPKVKPRPTLGGPSSCFVCVYDQNAYFAKKIKSLAHWKVAEDGGSLKD